jgi:serine O-acetyltransferase
MLGLGPIGRIAGGIRADVAAVRSRDPAARGVGVGEILATWPGLHAVLAYRAAHALQLAGVPVLPRALAALTRAITGIEIHPAAQIGRGFFIDHGMGVVIGETAEIGDDVTLYQGVTLGGTGFATGKRHPTVEDNVTVGSGAKLLGPIRVGHGSKIGANTVVIHDVPPNATVVGNPGHPVRVEGRRPEGPDADWIHLPDPVAEAIKGLASRIAVLEAIAEADGDLGAELEELKAAAARIGDGRANPATGPSPAGG